MKKILHIITGLSDGGAEAVLYRLCNFNKDHQHIVISLTDKGKYGPLLEAENIQTYYLNMPPSKIRLNSLYKLFKLIRQIRPDVVQTWMYHADLIGGVVAKLAGIKNIVWGVHHTNLTKSESKKTTILVAKFNALLSSFVPRKIIYCAEKARHIQESIGFKKAIGKVVHNGYSIDDFLPNVEMRNTFRQELQLPKKTFLIGHVGRYHPLKDYTSLIKAIDLLALSNNNFKVAMIGTMLDEKNSELTQHIDLMHCKDNFYLLGRRNDISRVMNGIDLFILSSTSEAFPNVLNEAMACGTPCVSTNVGDAAIIIGSTGWIVPTKNPPALANAITEAIKEQQDDPQAWLARKCACRQRIVENFSIENMISEYHRVWFNS